MSGVGLAFQEALDGASARLMRPSSSASSTARASRRVSRTPGRDTPGGIVHGHGRARAYPPSPARRKVKRSFF